MGNKPPEFSWDEATQVTEIPKTDDQATKTQPLDDFVENIEHIRSALKNRPTSGGYVTLIGMFLDKGAANIANNEILEKALDEANEIATDFNKWRKSNK